MQTAWTNFIKTGNPNEGSPLPEEIKWEPYRENGKNQLYIGDRIFNRRIPDAERLRFYENIVMNRKAEKE